MRKTLWGSPLRGLSGVHKGREGVLTHWSFVSSEQPKWYSFRMSSLADLKGFAQQARPPLVQTASPSFINQTGPQERSDFLFSALRDVVRKDIADYAGVKAEQVLFVNGSDQGIDLVVRCCCEFGSEVRGVGRWMSWRSRMWNFTLFLWRKQRELGVPGFFGFLSGFSWRSRKSSDGQRSSSHRPPSPCSSASALWGPWKRAKTRRFEAPENTSERRLKDVKRHKPCMKSYYIPGKRSNKTNTYVKRPFLRPQKSPNKKPPVDEGSKSKLSAAEAGGRERGLGDPSAKLYQGEGFSLGRGVSGGRCSRFGADRGGCFFLNKTKVRVKKVRA